METNIDDIIQQFNEINASMTPERISFLKGIRERVFLRKEKRGAYERTAEWRKKRRLKILATSGLCESCGQKSSRIHIHHAFGSYERYCFEAFHDLVVLCDRCHKEEHAKFSNDMFTKPFQDESIQFMFF